MAGPCRRTSGGLQEGSRVLCGVADLTGSEEAVASVSGGPAGGGSPSMAGVGSCGTGRGPGGAIWTVPWQLRPLPDGTPGPCPTPSTCPASSGKDGGDCSRRLAPRKGSGSEVGAQRCGNLRAKAGEGEAWRR